MTTTVAERTYKTDKYGFPVVACGRCGGGGNISGYSHVYGGTCFKCQGTGYLRPSGTAGKIADQFYSELRGSTVVNFAKDLAPGMVVKTHNGDDYLTVATVKRTAKIIGECRIGDAPVVYTFEHYVTFTDGTSIRHTGWQWRRKPHLTLDDAHAAAERSRAAYEKTLASRKRRAA